MELSTSPIPPDKKSHSFRKALLAGLVAYLVVSILSGIVIADTSLKLHRLPLRHQQAIAAAVRTDFGAELQDVAITAADGVPPKGWFVHPRLQRQCRNPAARNYRAVAHSAVPVLLIHGEDDRNIAPRHSQLISAVAPYHSELWLVPHAGHTMAWAAAHREFEGRLLGWFATHKRMQDNISNSAALTSF